MEEHNIAYNLLQYWQNTSDLTVYLMLLLVAITFIVYYTRGERYNLPPGPPRLPLIGSIPWIDRSNPLTSFTQWAKQYGPIVTFYIGSKRNVLVNDAKLARELLIKHGDVFSDRADLIGVRTKFGVKGGVILENGDDWKRHRRWVITGLRHFGMGKRSLEEQISTEAGKLCHEIEQQHAKFNPLKYVINAVSNIICSVSFGKRYEYDDPKFQDLLASVNAYFKYTHFGRIEDALPFLMKLYVKRSQHVNNIITFLKMHMKEHAETFDEKNIRDISDMLLLQFKEDLDAGEIVANAGNGTHGVGKSAYLAGKAVADDRDSLWRSILSLFLAGTDTTTSTIMWFLLYMICYPTVQQRVQDEIDKATDGQRPLTVQDKLKVPYFEATICEVQRLANIAGVLVPHCTTADSIVNGYDIPENTNFNIHLNLIHMDPKYWTDPDEFNPKRFLDEDEKTLKKGEAFMPFGLGRRACLGESLAKMELYIFLSRLLQRFKFELPESSPRPSFEPVVGVTQSPQSFEVVANPRR